MEKLAVGLLEKINKNRNLFLILANIIILIFGYAIGFGPGILVINLVATLFFLKPSYAIWFLVLFIPFKAFLRAEISSAPIITLFIPVALLFAFLGSKIRENKIILNKIDLYLILIFFASIFSTLGFLILFGFRTSLILDFFIWLQLVGFYLIGKEVINQKTFEFFLFVNLIVANIVSGWAIGQAILLKATPLWVESYETITVRAFGPLQNPNALAGYLLMILTGIFFYYQKKQRYLPLLFVLPIVAFLLTFSRGALVVFVLILVLFFIKEKKYLLLTFTVIFLVIAFSFAPAKFRLRITNIWSSNHYSYSVDSGRLWSLRNVFKINQKYFLFGRGWGSYGGEYAWENSSPVYLDGVQEGVVGVANTDNQWLQVFAQQGLIGLWLYVLMFSEAIKKNWNNNFALPILAFILLGLFIDVFQFYQISFFGWLYLGYLSKGLK